MIKQAEESAANTGEPKRRFWRLGFIFGSKSKSLQRSVSQDQLDRADNSIRQSFSSFFDKSSVFSRKLSNSKSEGTSPAAKSTSSEGEWTASPKFL